MPNPFPPPQTSLNASGLAQAVRSASSAIPCVICLVASLLFPAQMSFPVRCLPSSLGQESYSATLPSGLPLPQDGPRCLFSTGDISLTTPSLHRKFKALSKLLSESLQDEYMKSMNEQISSASTQFCPTPWTTSPSPNPLKASPGLPPIPDNLIPIQRLSGSHGSHKSRKGFKGGPLSLLKQQANPNLGSPGYPTSPNSFKPTIPPLIPGMWGFLSPRCLPGHSKRLIFPAAWKSWAHTGYRHLTVPAPTKLPECRCIPYASWHVLLPAGCGCSAAHTRRS